MRRIWGDRNSIERKCGTPAGDQQRRGVCASCSQLRPRRGAGRDLRDRTSSRKAMMQKRLPKSVFKSVIATIEHGATLDPAVADAVASAMKDWAMEKGATHYAHVFYPLTGLTAEKHDSFLEPGADGSGDRRVRRQDPDPGRARRVELPATAACAARSRPAATPAGTSPARRTSSRTRTATRCASRRCSCR